MKLKEIARIDDDTDDNEDMEDRSKAGKYF